MPPIGIRPFPIRRRSELTGTDIDFRGAAVCFKTLTGNVVFTISNPVLGRKVMLELGGVFTVTLPASVTVVNGDYCPDLGTNVLLLVCNDEETPTYLASWTVQI